MRRSQSSHNPSKDLLADNQMRLPKLQTPNFDGNILKWPEFGMFSSPLRRSRIFLF